MLYYVNIILIRVMSHYKYVVGIIKDKLIGCKDIIIIYNIMDLYMESFYLGLKMKFYM